jgi:hypothetical protein
MKVETVFFGNHGTKHTSWPFLIQITEFMKNLKVSEDYVRIN